MLQIQPKWAQDYNSGAWNPRENKVVRNGRCGRHENNANERSCFAACEQITVLVGREASRLGTEAGVHVSRAQKQTVSSSMGIVSASSSEFRILMTPASIPSRNSCIQHRVSVTFETP